MKQEEGKNYMKEIKLVCGIMRRKKLRFMKKSPEDRVISIFHLEKQRKIISIIFFQLLNYYLQEFY